MPTVSILDRFELLFSESVVRERDHGPELNRGVAPVEERAERPDAVAAERERIGGSGRREPDGETAGERVEAIGEGQDGRDVVGRDVVARARRLVVVADRVSDLARLVLREGVGAPHVPLKLRKFPDHQRHEVALAQAGGAADGPLHGGVQAEGAADEVRQALEACDLVTHGPQPMLEYDSAELFVSRVERRLLVLSPKKPRVREACSHDAVGALRDEVRSVGGVHDREVARQELALTAGWRGTVHAEVPLVSPRHGTDDGGRKIEERGVERAGDHVWLLDQRRVLADQHLLVVVLSTGRSRRFIDARHHRSHPLVAIDQHVPLAKPVDVRVGARQVERRRRKKAVSA